MAEFDLGKLEVSGSPGLDALFEREHTLLRPHQRSGKVRVASVSQLQPFTRLSAETLIHKSDRDLWTLRKEADGQFYIERLFDDTGEPLKEG